MSRVRGSTQTIYSLLLLLTLSLFPHSARSVELQSAKSTQVPEAVYRIPLRVHLGYSNRALRDWLPILEEINSIWLSQAGICFEIQTVDHDEKAADGLDLWFEATIPDWNGYYSDGHDIHVRDNPDLNPATRPALSSAARTAAHEMGHALRLGHNQDSDDNLMRSKTYGWQLHPFEIQSAREEAKQLALKNTAPGSCSPVRILPPSHP